MITKVTYNDSYEDLIRLVDGPMTRLIDTSSRGSIIKSAASDVFTLADIAKYTPDDDHFMLHVIAMGGHPTYMPNRNGDAFPSSSLENYHDTFVKNGHFYREHNHSSPSLAIGMVKASAYNKPMDRVELLIHGHKKKAAEEYEKAKAGKELSFSMSARLNFDSCSCCLKKSAKVSDYCPHLKYQMGQYIPEFKKYAFAINEKPTFFDISRVSRPADRIAHYISYKFGDDEMKKAASHSSIVIPAWEAAKMEGVNINSDSPYEGTYKNTLEKLASAEEWLKGIMNEKPATYEYQYFSEILPNYFKDQAECSVAAWEDCRSGEIFGKLAKRASILDPKTLYSHLKVDSLNVGNLTNIFSTLLKSAECGQCVDDMSPMFEGFDPSHYGEVDHDQIDSVMSKMAEQFSCKMEPIKSKTITIIIKSAYVTAHKYTFENAKPTDDGMVYGSYQVAAFEDIVKYANQDEDYVAKYIAAYNLHLSNQ